jgi:alpha-1,6-mannosyltransferase
MTLRIVDVCGFYTPQGGGVKTYVERKLKAAREGEHHVVILAPGAEDGVIHREAAGEIRAIRGTTFPLDRRYRYFGDEAALHAALDRLAPDIVECSSPWSSAAMVGRWPGDAPRSLVMHADPLAAYPYRWFEGIAERETIDRGFDWFWRHLRRLGRQYELVVTANEPLSQRLRAGGVGGVRTLPMGVEPGLFSPALRDEGLRARLLARCGLGPEATLLIALGRHSSEKRWPMVIDAVAAAGYQRPVGLVLFGDGPRRTQVLRAAAANPHIHLAAPVADRRAVATLLASGDALVHGCEAETFGMVAAEARASGLPLIVPDEGGAADQHVPGAGARYEARRPAALAEAIVAFIDAGPAGARARAAAAAGATMTMDRHFDRLFSLYATFGRRLRHAA